MISIRAACLQAWQDASMVELTSASVDVLFHIQILRRTRQAGLWVSAEYLRQARRSLLNDDIVFSFVSLTGDSISVDMANTAHRSYSHGHPLSFRHSSIPATHVQVDTALRPALIACTSARLFALPRA